MKHGRKQSREAGVRLLLVMLVLLLLPDSASAHVQGSDAVGFVTGLLHPVSGLDHVLALIAVGLWGAQLGQPAVWLLPVTFPMVMAFGGMLALIGIPLPGIEVGIAASAIILGIAVLREARPRLAVAAFVIALFAIFHGHAHGTELPEGENGLVYSMGFVIATGSLHATGVCIGLVHRWSWGQRVLRLVGGCVAVAGLLFMWRAIQ
jgi:urease accessory protein